MPHTTVCTRILLVVAILLGVPVGSAHANLITFEFSGPVVGGSTGFESWWANMYGPDAFAAVSFSVDTTAAPVSTTLPAGPGGWAQSEFAASATVNFRNRAYYPDFLGVFDATAIYYEDASGFDPASITFMLPPIFWDPVRDYYHLGGGAPLVPGVLKVILATPPPAEASAITRFPVVTNAQVGTGDNDVSFGTWSYGLRDVTGTVVTGGCCHYIWMPDVSLDVRLVPSPSPATLVLIGVCVMALRRRRQNVS